jgi:hypothetical protein
MIISQDLIDIAQEIISDPEKSKQFLIRAGILDKDTGELVDELKEELL